MSNPTRKLRQPGLKATPRACGACKPGSGPGDMTLDIQNFLSCTFLNGQYSPQPVNSMTCDNTVDGACNWIIIENVGGHEIEITVTLKCVLGIPTFDCTINDNTAGQLIAEGFFNAAPTACGALDCAAMSSWSAWTNFTTINTTTMCGTPAQVGTPSFRLQFAGGAGCTAPNCCCGGPPAHPCTDCCNTGTHTLWDVDLTGITVGGGSSMCILDVIMAGCDATSCNALKGVFTLANSGSLPCVWKYFVPICSFPDGGQTITAGYNLKLEATTTSGGCNWLLTISSQSTSGAPPIYYSATKTGFDCTGPITLSYVSGGPTTSCVCNVTWPSTLTISPA